MGSQMNLENTKNIFWSQQNKTKSNKESISLHIHAMVARLFFYISCCLKINTLALHIGPLLWDAVHSKLPHCEMQSLWNSLTAILSKVLFYGWETHSCSRARTVSLHFSLWIWNVIVSSQVLCVSRLWSKP